MEMDRDSIQGGILETTLGLLIHLLVRSEVQKLGKGVHVPHLGSNVDATKPLKARDASL